MELNRPSYIGQVVLDLSKLRMYQLQYIDLERYRQDLNCEIKIVAGDTDSFFLQCKNVDLRTQLIPRMIEDRLLDTSNYPADDPLYSNGICSVIGKIKDESEGKGYSEWIFLKPKCYSLRGQKETMKAKGITLKGAGITFNDYKRAYQDSTIKYIKQTKFVSRAHQIYTETTMKKGLHCFDDKRYWTDENTSVAYGHHSILDFLNDINVYIITLSCLHFNNFIIIFIIL